MKTMALLALATGCASSYQSARAVPVGKVQITTAATRGEVSNMDGSAWFGDVQLRTGLADRVDGGIRLVRSPSARSTTSGLGFDSKLELTPHGARNTFSASGSIAMMWEENGTRFQDPIVAVMPTLYFGTEVSPDVEVVLAAKYVALIPDNGNRQDLYGVSVGLRISEPSKSWAVQPELTYLKLDAGMGDHSVLLGIGLAVGN